MPFIELDLPIQGILKAFPSDKPAKSMSEYMNNVRLGVLEGKIRICQRPALDKWGAGTQIGAAENPVVAMCTVSAVT